MHCPNNLSLDTDYLDQYPVQFVPCSVSQSTLSIASCRLSQRWLSEEPNLQEFRSVGAIRAYMKNKQTQPSFKLTKTFVSLIHQKVHILQGFCGKKLDPISTFKPWYLQEKNMCFRQQTQTDTKQHR